MGRFNRDSRSGGSRDSGSRGFGNRGGGNRSFGNDSGRSQMHKAVCDDCGNECEVPFRPTGDRPVYCNSCFGKHGNKPSGRVEGNDYPRSGFDDKKMFSAVCDKCGNKCEVPFRPTGGKPVYCKQCFGKGDKPSAGNNDQLKEQFQILNAKLDKILKSLNPTVSTEAILNLPVVKTTEVLKKVKENPVKTKVLVKKSKLKKKK
jgi:CxxC-x17-CxxC domain-containing protein